MAEILLVNPRRRKRRKMSAKQRKYFGKRRTRSAAPKRRRRRAVARVSNPRRRRRSLTKLFRRRRHSNPSLRGSLGSAVPMVKAGAVGAAGAIGLDLLWGYGKSYLPASIAGSPLAQYAAKLAGALLVGIVGNKVLRGRGRDMAVGATTVVLHDAFKAQLQASFPTLQLGEYLTYAPTVGGTLQRAMLRGVPSQNSGMAGVGEYLSGIPDQDDNGTYSGEWNGDGTNGY